LKKHTLEFVIKEFIDNGCELIDGKYLNNRVPLKYRCSCGTIGYIRFDDFRHGVRCKSCGYNKPTKHHDLSVSPQQLELIVGSLLGDGSLTKVYSKNQNSAFVETHGAKQKSYIDWKRRLLHPFSYNRLLKDERPAIVSKDNGKLLQIETRLIPCYTLKTTAHLAFKQLEEKWYKRVGGEYLFNEIGHRIKIVPMDVLLTPFSLAVWYFDDGYNHPKKKYFVICSQSFTKDECILLTEKIKLFGIQSNVTKERKIYIGPKFYNDFATLIKEYLPTKELSYKVRN